MNLKFVFKKGKIKQNQNYIISKGNNGKLKKRKKQNNFLK